MIGRLGRAVTHVATPFHPFGGAVDIIVVKQHDGSFRTTPWYVRFGKFQGVLKGAEKLVTIEVNGVEADFHMHLDNSGEAHFVEQSNPDNFVDPTDENGSEFSKMEENDSGQIFYEFQDKLSSLEGSSDYGSSRFDNLDSLDLENTLESQDSGSGVVLVSVDGHILTAPLSKSERNADYLHEDENNAVEATWSDLHSGDVFKSCIELSELAMKEVEKNVGSSEEINGETKDHKISRNDDASFDTNSHAQAQIEAANLERTSGVISDCPNSMRFQSLNDLTGENRAVERVQTGEEIPPLNGSKTENGELHTAASMGKTKVDLFSDLEISLCGHLLTARMGLGAAELAFNSNRISMEEFKLSSESLVKNENLIVRVKGMYLPWEKVAHIILGMAVFGLSLPIDPFNVVPVESDALEVKEENVTPSRKWRLWPFKRVKTLERINSNASSESISVDTESVSSGQAEATTPMARAHPAKSPCKQIIRTNVPTTDQIASLNLNEGQNMVTFHFSTRVLGSQKVEAHIYLWKWNTRIVISDVDGTITKSDVLGQFMPLVGKDWTHSGIARLFCAIKENGYQLLFLSARAIVQAYLTKSFLFNLKQDGNSLPNGPVVISPDGLFPSLYREVIRRAPHEFKIGCLEDIKALFPPNYNPFYAGFGNRDTDELSYRKIGIPKGKIFIINPRGEVAINNRIDVKSYTSLHTLVHDMFPPTSLVNDNSPTSLAEKEEYNEWNYWRAPLPEL